MMMSQQNGFFEDKATNTVTTAFQYYPCAPVETGFPPSPSRSPGGPPAAGPESGPVPLLQPVHLSGADDSLPWNSKREAGRGCRSRSAPRGGGVGACSPSNPSRKGSMRYIFPVWIAALWAVKNGAPGRRKVEPRHAELASKGQGPRRREMWAQLFCFAYWAQQLVAHTHARLLAHTRSSRPGWSPRLSAIDRPSQRRIGHSCTAAC
jgi:hypothetical protein